MSGKKKADGWVVRWRDGSGHIRFRRLTGDKAEDTARAFAARKGPTRAVEVIAPGGEAEKPEPRVIREQTMDLPCALTDAERIERGGRLAGILQDMKAEESRADMVKQGLKSAMTALVAEQDRLATLVQNGEELRPIVVQDIADDARGMVVRIRLDTRAQVGSEREMTDEERQLPIPFGPPALTVVPGGAETTPAPTTEGGGE